MYSAILLVLVLAGASLVAHGVRRRNFRQAAAGVAVLLATLVFFSTLDAWGELLWFESVGYGGRFWKVLRAQVFSGAVFGMAGWLVVYLLTLPLRRNVAARYWPELAGLGLGAAWGGGNWERIVLFLHGGEAGVADPILGRDAGFYLFRLPFYAELLGLAVVLVVIVAIASVAALVTQAGVETVRRWMDTRLGGANRGAHPIIIRPAFAFEFLFVPAGALMLLIAWWHYLGVYMLMYSPLGVVFGPGWTDVHVRLPGHIIVGMLALLLGIGLVLPPLHGAFHRGFRWLVPGMGAFLGPLLVVGIAWVLALGAAPTLAQWLVVTPNEITLERPYILNNIRFTRIGFALNRAEEREFPMGGTLDPATVSKSKDLLDNVRLWDWRALAAVYHQFQAIRLYYDFHDVDIDRYSYGGKYRQVMLSARELNQATLPEQSQTFVNQRFKYTHGYGMVMSDVSTFTREGLPNLLIKDIPPVSQFPELRIDRPQIYYGEKTDSYVIANSATPEFDYPKGEENAYTDYAGRGGVLLENLWRKFLFGWKFDGTRFFFSSYPRANSRIMFHRNIRDSVETLAPFLKFDTDPYMVLVDGRLYWIIDAYTTSPHFPYSTPFTAGQGTSGMGTAMPNAGNLFEDANYVRNSVKAVVDAYDGAVTFYVFEPFDPLIRAWSAVFPDLFQPASKMPGGLLAHIRYPHHFLLAQGLVHAKYHMEDPAVFYNQEDLWVRATEKYAGRVQPIDPYYVMWALPPDLQRRQMPLVPIPGPVPPAAVEPRLIAMNPTAAGSPPAAPPGQGPAAKSTTRVPEFSVILPFTPKNRQVLIGWIAGLCDGANYGRLITYRFSKDKTVIGPQQFETKIDQDAYLSGQLTLWDQHGSHVVRGDVLAIPLDNTLLYVEPIYLQADTAAYPELRLVALMHGETLAYAETFDAALQKLLQGGGGQAAATVQGGAAASKTPQAPSQPPQQQQPAGPVVNQALVKEANEAFESYLRLQGQGKFVEAAQQLERLRSALQRMQAGK